MADLTINDVGDATMRILEARAKAKGQSLEDYVRDLIEKFARNLDVTVE